MKDQLNFWKSTGILNLVPDPDPPPKPPPDPPPDEPPPRHDGD